MAATRPSKQKSPRRSTKPRRQYRWASKDGYTSLPKYDCQSPLQKRQKIKRLDCEAHASTLRQRLQDLLETQNTDSLYDTVTESSVKPNAEYPQQEKAPEVNHQPPLLTNSWVANYDNALNECLREVELNPRNPKVLWRLASIYTRLGRSQDALHTYVRIQKACGPSAPRPWLDRPKAIPMEVPHINPGFTAALVAPSKPVPAEVKRNEISLFDPSSLLNISTQRITTRVFSNMNFTGYTPVVGLGVQPPPYALLR